jgi:hypothetical protein
MSSNDEFFRERRAAAVFKHGILKRYPVVFASKTGQWSKGHRVVFLDGYAGRGRYDKGEPGSPMLLAQRCRQHLCLHVAVDDWGFRRDGPRLSCLS